MTRPQDERPWPKPRPTAWIRNWLVALLMLVIAANELQRTSAQAAAHRERLEQSIKLAELDRKIDWLLLTTPPPTASAPTRRPFPAPASSALGR